MLVSDDSEQHQHVVDYIGELTVQLAQMAKAADCQSLALLLDMAAREARGVGNSSGGDIASLTYSSH